MSFSSSSVIPNKLLAWSMGNGGKGYVRIQFPFDLAWYYEQPSTKFLSFQHRKEPNGLRHEFIVLQMTDGSICRVERMGDPNARINALSAQGSTAYDLAQCFRPGYITEAGLSTSVIVAEVKIPRELDLKDVLNICRAIQEAGKTRSYTLQTFNCYFFSLTLQSCLTRLVANWEDTIIYSHETWKSNIKTIAGLLLGIDSRKQPLLRACFILGLHPSPPPIMIQDAFYKNTLELAPQTVVDKVFWYHELETKLDNIITDELERAWWTALNMYFGCIQGKQDKPDLDQSIEGPKMHMYQCGHALQDIAQCFGVRDEQSYIQIRPRKLQPTCLQYSQLQTYPNNMDYKGDKLNEFEQVEALTISQWLVVMWLHARQLCIQVIGVFIALSFGLLTFLSNYPTYVDTELEHMVSRLEQSNGTESKELPEFMEKLRELRQKRNLVWKELPWVHVQSQLRGCLPSSPSLGRESTLIQVTLEGRESSRISISVFQKHIIRRIALQASLVERVGLGRSAKISTEIQHRLSHVWATIRNDEYDTNSSLEPKPPVVLSDTAFDRRVGTHRFREPTQVNSWTSLVNHWHQKLYRGLPIEYVIARVPNTPDHAPEWTVTPKILGELNSDYMSTGPTIRGATEESARLIAASGHC